MRRVLVAAAAALIAWIVYGVVKTSWVKHKVDQNTRKLFDVAQAGNLAKVGANQSLCSPEVLDKMLLQQGQNGQVLSYKIEKVLVAPFGSPWEVYVKVRRTGGTREEVVNGFESMVPTYWRVVKN